MGLPVEVPCTRVDVPMFIKEVKRFRASDGDQSGVRPLGELSRMGVTVGPVVHSFSFVGIDDPPTDSPVTSVYRDLQFHVV